MKNANQKYIVCDIDEHIIETWNKRLADKIDSSPLTQSQLSKDINAKYETSFTQTMLSRWTHVGEPGKGYPKRLPDYQNMHILADYFNVNVGFLTGETDCSTFQMQDACTYLGLDEDAIESLRQNTGQTDGNNFSAKYFPTETQNALNRLLHSQGLSELLEEMAHIEIETKDKGLKHLESKIGSTRFAKAADMHASPIDYEHDPNAPFVDEQTKADYCAFSQAIDEDYISTESMRLHRYALHEVFTRILDEIYPV